MPTFTPNLAILPPAQRRLWPELAATPPDFTMYGGTALALRLGHRTSVDFDFFSVKPFDPERLANQVSYLLGAERVQVEANTLTCRVDRNGPVLVSFFGGLRIGQVAERDQASDLPLFVACAGPYRRRRGSVKKIPPTPDLLRVAQRVVWFKEPADTLRDPVHFLAHVMTYGTVEDLRAVSNVVGREEFREALERAPAGVFDARSWSYWNLVVGRVPAPAMPVRRAVLI